MEVPEQHKNVKRANSSSDNADVFDVVLAAERYLVLLLGCSKQPVPSKLHIQKELFILSNINKNISPILKFIPHYLGPYSPLIDESLEYQSYYGDAFLNDNGRFYLTKTGEYHFLNLVNECDSADFRNFLISIKFVRELYDRLSDNELLLLMYETFPEYKLKSEVYSTFVENPSLTKQIVVNLFSKGVITESRRDELLAGLHA